MADIPLSINALLNQFDFYWNDGSFGTGVTVRYSFPNTGLLGGAFSIPQSVNAIHALNAWADVADVTLEFVNALEGADIKFRLTELTNGAGSTYLPHSGIFGGGVYIDPDFPPAADGFGFYNLVHEIGHALGLKHPGNYDAGGNGPPPPYLPGPEDNWLYSVMSYHQVEGDDIANVAPKPYFPVTPMLYDVAAIQYVYGANLNNHTGDDSYELTPSIMRTIWDTGGTDTITVSSAVTSATIDLRPGRITSLNGIQLAAIALNPADVSDSVTAIENAIGSSGADYIIGNAADNILTSNGGRDRIDGGKGADTIDGGDDVDTAVYDGLTQTHFNIQRHGNTVTVAGKFQVDRDIYGSDTLTNVEQLEFFDAVLGKKIINVADLPDLDAGTVAGGKPSDGGVTPVNGGASGNESTTGNVTAGAPIVGNNTSEYLTGTGGPETISGMGGDDVLTGYGGQDTFDGGLGSDTVDYSYQPASVSGTVDLAADTATFPGFYTEQLVSIENVWMGAGNDHVYGDTGNNDLRGGPGNDVLRGGTGNDVIYGDWRYSDQGGNDTAILAYSYGSSYTVSGSVSALHLVGSEGDDWYYNIESFQFAGSVTKTATEVLQSRTFTTGAQAIERVSVATNGNQQNGGYDSSRNPGLLSVTADGRYVAYESEASNLVAGDTNGNPDIFVFDRLTHTTERVSVASDGTQSQSSFSNNKAPSISGDGRYVVFLSDASNLVPNDTNNTADVFIHDRVTHATSRVSVGTNGTQSNGESFAPSISSDGRYIAFWSSASNFVSGDTNAKQDLFVFDRLTLEAKRVSVASDGTESNAAFDSGALDFPIISADGRFVAFTSYATNLVSNDTNNARDIFVRDNTTHVTSRVSVSSDGTQANGDSFYASISGDGRFIAFVSMATNLGSSGSTDLFVHDRTLHTTERIPINGFPINALPLMSMDGRYVTFAGSEPNLVPNDTNNASDVFVYDRGTQTTTRVSVADDGSQAANFGTTSGLFRPVISGDGRFISFYSGASNLVQGDTNGTVDVFVVDRQPNSPPIARADALTTDNGSPVTGNVFVDNGHGGDSDAGGDALAVVAINSNTGNIGVSTTLASGALVVVNPDGRFAYDPNGKFTNLNAGQTATDSFSYTISDGQGNTSTAVVTLTIVGTVHGLVVTGGSGILNGTSGDDQISAGSGDVTIHGGAGYDWLQGGAGFDNVYGDDGDDVLAGIGGINHLIGGAGADVLDGTGGLSFADYSTATAGLTASLVDPATNTGDAAGDTYTSVFGLIGSNFGDALSLDNAAGSIWANGGNDMLTGGSGADDLHGGGGINHLIGGAGADVLDGAGGLSFANYSTAGAGVTASLVNVAANTGDATGDSYISMFGLIGSGFDDTLTIGNGGGSIYGGGGNDFVTGGTGNDDLHGQGGINHLIGGAGADALDGGGGLSFANYSTASNGIMANLASAGSNTGDAAGDVYSSMFGLIGTSFDDTLTIGNGGGSVYGGGGNDNVYGGSGADDLHGGGGINHLIGGAGADALDGTGGLSFANYSAAVGGLIVNTADTSGNLGDATGDTFNAIYGIIGSQFDDVLRIGNSGGSIWGNDGNDYVIGGNGVDDLHGGGGINHLIGGAGADVLDGTGGLSFADYSTAAGGLIANIADTSGNLGDATGDSFTSIYGIVGSQFDDVLRIGNSGGSIWGNDGNDYLIGGNGVDDLHGQGGINHLIGGAGADVLDGSIGLSFANYSTAAAAVVANLVSAGANTGDAAGDTYNSIFGLIGSEFDDTLRIGNGGGSIYGGGGNDTAIGGTGNDDLHGQGGINHLIGGAGADVLNGAGGLAFANYSTAGAGVVANLVSAGANTGDAAGDTYNSIFGLIGSNLDDTLVIGSGGGSIWTGGGNDTAIGGTGNDDLHGQGGINHLIGGAGADVLDGSIGLSFANYSTSGSGLLVNLGNAGSNTGDAAGDSYNAIYGIIGSGFADTLTLGSGGRSTWAGGGNDVLFGSGGVDDLHGQDGNDLIVGGTGADQVDGGAGNDIFAFQRGDGGGDTVADFAGNGAAAGDSLQFSGFGTAGQGATFTQTDATHWSINSADGQIHDVVTFANAASIHASDYSFV